MNLPQIELIPLRPVVSSDRSSTLDLLVKIVPLSKLSISKDRR
jgi:hypothetical protein